MRCAVSGRFRRWPRHSGAPWRRGSIESSSSGFAAAVEAAGLTFRYIPVISGQMTADNVVDQAEALDELPAPVFAYCRSGTRSTNLFVAAQQMKG